MSPTLSLIIPTFNEAENVPVLVERVAAVLSGQGIDYELIVVDDDSPDRTWEIAESLRTRFPQVRVIRRTSGDKGLAPAVAEGWRQARGELLGVMDADLQHPPQVLTELLEAFADPAVDLAIASRYTPSGGSRGLNPIRKWLSRGASNLAQAVLPPAAHGVTDPMSGFFVLRRRVIEQVVLSPKGYKILLEVLARGRYRRIAEVPYRFGRRTRGESKLGTKVTWDYLHQLWQLVWAPTGFGRFVRFCLVGATGVVVNMGILWWLKGSGLLGTLQAGAAAVECAILNNFLWNEAWTFRDRSALRPLLHDRLWRLAHFNLICGAGAAFHLSMLWLLAVKLGWNYLAANAIAIGLVTFWNYGLNTSWTWTRLTRAGASRRQQGDTSRAATWLVVALALGWLALQGWLVGARWVNPDEGAHLMDTRFVMQGLVPEVDYGARQPLYVYAYVPFLKLLGHGYLGARWMPLLATLLSGWVLYLIGRRLWGRDAGRYAAVLYLLAPMTLLNSSVVKTEPLTILLTCLGMLGLILHFQDQRWWPLFWAGAAFGAGYYVRESALAGPLAASVVFLFHVRQGLRPLLRRLAALGAGWVATCGAVLAFYSAHLPWPALLSNEALFPPYRIWITLMEIGGWWQPQTMVAVDTIRRSAQSWPATLHNLHDALQLNLPLLAGAAVAAWVWLERRVTRRGRLAPAARWDRLGFSVAFAWLGSFTALYAYHILQRGFFQFYFREFLPPLVLLLGVVLVRQFQAAGWERPGPGLLAGWLAVCLGVFALQMRLEGGGALLALPVIALIGWGAFRDALQTAGRLALYVAGAAAFMAACALMRLTDVAGPVRHLAGGWVVGTGILLVVLFARMATRRLAWQRAVSFVALAWIASAGVATASFGAGILRLSYNCAWPPETVRRITEVVQANSAPGDEVLSGGVIWEFEADREPFLRISHPLSFMDAMSDDTARRIRERLRERPPRIVVMDGYTERTYVRQIPELPSVLAASYRFVERVESWKHTVSVYVLEGSRAMQAVAMSGEAE